MLNNGNRPNSQRSRSRRTRPSNRRSTYTATFNALRNADPRPPSYNSSHHYTKKIRFDITAPLVQYQIRSPDVANLLLVCNDVLTGTGTVTASAIWSRFRFLNAKLWATRITSAPVDISLSMVDPTNLAAVNSEKTVADIGTSDSRYAYVKLTPSFGSIGADWQNAASAGWGLEITAPESAILELSLEVYINNFDPIQVVTAYGGVPLDPFTNPNIVAGAVFMNYLDPSPSGTNPGVIIPVDYQTNGASSVATARPL
jgi:hypothetical protein